LILPGTDPAPADFLSAISPDGARRAFIDDGNIRVVDLKASRSSSELVFLAQLNDVPSRLRWHRAEVADSEAKQQWFAAAFHLRQLLAANPSDADQLRKRLKRDEQYALRADKVWLGISLQQINKIIDEYRTRDWHPATVKGYAKDDTNIYDVTWARGRVAWQFYLGMSPIEFKMKNAEFAKLGFKIVSESRWKLGAETRIAAIWHK
jgi:hypothetical protein